MPQVAVHGVQRAIADSVQTWLEVHPVVHWLVNHPIWGLILTVTSVFLLWGLLQAVADLTQQFWRMLIRLPFRLGKWLSSQLVRLGLLGLDKVRSALLTRGESRMGGQPRSSIKTQKAVDSLGVMASQQAAMNHLLESAPVQDHTIDPAIANGVVSIELEELKPLENSSDIVRLLHRLEELSQEQNQILRQIATLAEESAIDRKETAKDSHL